jgi:hypothetical protein
MNKIPKVALGSRQASRPRKQLSDGEIPKARPWEFSGYSAEVDDGFERQCGRKAIGVSANYPETPKDKPWGSKESKEATFLGRLNLTIPRASLGDSDSKATALACGQIKMERCDVGDPQLGGRNSAERRDHFDIAAARMTLGRSMVRLSFTVKKTKLFMIAIATIRAEQSRHLPTRRAPAAAQVPELLQASKLAQQGSAAARWTVTSLPIRR